MEITWVKIINEPQPEGGKVAQKSFEEIFNEAFEKASKNINERHELFCIQNGLDRKDEIKNMYDFMNENPYYLSQGTLGK